MFLGIVHFITATRFHMGYVQPLESQLQLQGAAIRGCSYLAKQYINYGVDINATEYLMASPSTPAMFPEMNGWGTYLLFLQFTLHPFLDRLKLWTF